MLLRSVDLNLIPVLRELLREKNVSRAAANLGLSQSATSAALARLRATLRDPLLVQVGRRMELTERAKELVAPVQIAAEAAEALWQRRGFDPATATREFVVATADYAAMILAPRLIAHLREHAPGITLQFIDINARSIERIRHGDIDIGMLPRSVLEQLGSGELRSALLFRDEFVAVAAKGARRAAAKNGEAFATFKVGIVDSESAAERWVAGHRDVLKTIYSFQQFSMLPFMAVEAGVTALVQRRLAERLAKYLPIRIVPSPIPATKIELHAIWSAARQQDQAHRWLLDLLRTIAKAEGR
jgi:DNA-binding transcriptional LysR family regulator